MWLALEDSPVVALPVQLLFPRHVGWGGKHETLGKAAGILQEPLADSTLKRAEQPRELARRKPGLYHHAKQRKKALSPDPAAGCCLIITKNKGITERGSSVESVLCRRIQPSGPDSRPTSDILKPAGRAVMAASRAGLMRKRA